MRHFIAIMLAPTPIFIVVSAGAVGSARCDIQGGNGDDVLTGTP